MDSLLKDRLTLIAALGTGVVVGISGIYMYYKLNRTFSRELSHLAGTIESLRREIEQLKVNSGPTATGLTASNADRRVHGASSSVNRGASVLTATAGTSSLEDADEEFYDFTDTEEALESWAAMNGPVVVEKKDEPATFYDELDQLLDGSSAEREAAYKMLEERKELQDDAECLWRFAKVCHLLGINAQKQGDQEKKRQLAFEAFEHAKQALEIEKDNPEVHKWYAITIGSLGDFVSTTEKIQNGHAFKEHVDEAIRLKPEDPTLYHMLGRWTFEIYSLSWIEKKVASTLYANVPEVSIEDAINYFLKTHSLNPNWKENMLYIAKAYIMEGKYQSAISWIDKATELQNRSEDDEIAQNELENLQYKYRSYRV